MLTQKTFADSVAAKLQCHASAILFYGCRLGMCCKI